MAGHVGPIGASIFCWNIKGLVPLIYITNLSSDYLANKQSFHIRSQGLEISTLIEQKKTKITPPLPLQKKLA